MFSRISKGGGAAVATIATTIAISGLLLVASPAAADEQTKRAGRSAGYGVAAFLGSVVYAPAKIVYAAGGSVVGGMAYLVSGADSRVSDPIMNAALRGDYVLTPSQIRGDESIEFVGRQPTDPQPTEASEVASDY